MSFFQSTLPGRGATINPVTYIFRANFQSTLPGRGATALVRILQTCYTLSIHAPRAGSDVRALSLCTPNVAFNPRSPGGERRNILAIGVEASYTFNPRSPGGERHKLDGRARFVQILSIHAPRAGSDDVYTAQKLLGHAFQSTLPGRGATNDYIGMRQTFIFQSTLPGRGATSITPSCKTSFLTFNPRSPGGERRSRGDLNTHRFHFQSTLPGRGATVLVEANERRKRCFQSTLPGRGATTTQTILTHRLRPFNPRSPGGERPSNHADVGHWFPFQSTLPGRGATWSKMVKLFLR